MKTSDQQKIVLYLKFLFGFVLGFVLAWGVKS